ncbi:hypothetical protein N7478_006691 [Penicillium angulare]|uniref:uncharacterized protein n=1 Tax=Penicillium angulare TaxID=116970 RepID=UPI0025409F30|nr:uncharacterized protein N7478_006691 [Penicillium angulare]KAJ5281319.1 hypothetical protein N7478_006691 [Penicillium angulare]
MYNSHTDIWIAGAFAAVVVDFIVYPFDTLKTRIQSPNYERVFKNARTGAVKRNVLFKGLYQGVWSVVFSTIPSSGAFFTTYEAVKYAFYNSSTNPDRHGPLAHTSRSTISLPFTHSLPTPIIHAIASSSGEMVSCLMLTPAEVLKQNAQMVNKSQTGGFYKNNAMRHVLSKFKSHPWRLWSGYTALFPLFEYIRSHMIAWRRKRRHPHREPLAPSFGSTQREALIERAGLTGLSAAASGIVSSFVTTPIDVVKTRVMLSATDDIEEGNRGSKNKTYKKGTLALGREIFREEGAKGLFKGGAIRSGWTAVSMSLYLSLYESGRMFLENRRRNLEGVSGATFTDEGDLIS